MHRALVGDFHQPAYRWSASRRAPRSGSRVRSGRECLRGFRISAQILRGESCCVLRRHRDALPIGSVFAVGNNKAAWVMEVQAPRPASRKSVRSGAGILAAGGHRFRRPASCAGPIVTVCLKLAGAGFRAPRTQARRFSKVRGGLRRDGFRCSVRPRRRWTSAT